MPSLQLVPGLVADELGEIGRSDDIGEDEGACHAGCGAGAALAGRHNGMIDKTDMEKQAINRVWGVAGFREAIASNVPVPWAACRNRSSPPPKTCVVTTMAAPSRYEETRAAIRSLMTRLGMSEDDISHLRGLDYSKNLEDAIERVESGAADAGFFMRATPVEQVREVAEAGESMPPKSTYFYPKVPTGLVFNPLA